MTTDVEAKTKQNEKLTGLKKKQKGKGSSSLTAEIRLSIAQQRVMTSVSVYIFKLLWTTTIISFHFGTIALWSFTSTTLYAIRFQRSDENIIFPAVMPSVRMLIPQHKRVIWHMIAKKHSSWLLILKSAEQSKKEIAGCVICEATKISFFRL